MSTDSNRGSNPSVWDDTRWREFESAERHLIHHALRMLAKYPGDDQAASTRLADEIWNLHSAHVNSPPRDSGIRPQSEQRWRSGLWRQRQ